MTAQVLPLVDMTMGESIIGMALMKAEEILIVSMTALEVTWAAHEMTSFMIVQGVTSAIAKMTSITTNQGHI